MPATSSHEMICVSSCLKAIIGKIISHMRIACATRICRKWCACAYKRAGIAGTTHIVMLTALDS
eukprot:15457-Heterococcus_DN1.PRE.2